MATVLEAILQSYYADVSRNIKADPWNTFVWSLFQKYQCDCTEQKWFSFFSSLLWHGRNAHPSGFNVGSGHTKCGQR